MLTYGDLKLTPNRRHSEDASSRVQGTVSYRPHVIDNRPVLQEL